MTENKIQETIDRLKAIDKYAAFKALCEALGLGEDGGLAHQAKLGRVRDRIVELLEEAQASQLPEGVEWPRTDKGGLVVFNEPLYALWDGDEEIDHWWPTKVEFIASGTTAIYASEAAKITLKRGERVKTEAPDSQEKIDDDATMSPHAYCKKVLGWDDYKRRAATFEEKIQAMNKDLLRRQRKLDARK